METFLLYFIDNKTWHILWRSTCISHYHKELRWVKRSLWSGQLLINVSSRSEITVVLVTRLVNSELMKYGASISLRLGGLLLMLSIFNEAAVERYIWFDALQWVELMEKMSLSAINMLKDNLYIYICILAYTFLVNILKILVTLRMGNHYLAV